VSRAKTGPRWTDASPVREHVHAMLALGSECAAIERAAGVPLMTAWRLDRHDSVSILTTNARKLLAMPVALYVDERPTTRPYRIELTRKAKHGTRRGYDLGCGCLPCRAAAKRYHAGRVGLSARTYVPTEPVRAHIESLIASGMKPSHIAKAAGVDYCTVYNARHGKHPSMQRAKAEALFAVTPQAVPDPWMYVPAGPTRAVINDLHKRGFSYAWVERSCGLTRVPRPDQRYVRRWVADKVADLSAFVGESGPVSSHTMVGCDRERLRDLLGTDMKSVAEVHGVNVRTLLRASKDGRISIDLLDAIATDHGLHVVELVMA